MVRCVSTRPASARTTDRCTPASTRASDPVGDIGLSLVGAVAACRRSSGRNDGRVLRAGRVAGVPGRRSPAYYRICGPKKQDVGRDDRRVARVVKLWLRIVLFSDTMTRLTFRTQQHVPIMAGLQCLTLVVTEFDT